MSIHVKEFQIVKFHELISLSLGCVSGVVSLNFCVFHENHDGDLLCAFCFFISCVQQQQVRR